MRVTFYLIVFLIIYIPVHAQQGDFATATDHKIFYQIFNKGKPMVIINGGPGMNSKGFAEMAKALAGRLGYQTIIYDQRGTGRSQLKTVNTNSITLDLMVADLEALRKHLGLNEWVVLGHSFGGMLASYYATKHPHVISKMILSSSGGIDMDLFSQVDIQSKLTADERDSLRYWGDKIANGDTTKYAALQRAKYMAPAYLYDKSYVPVIAERLIQVNMDINRLVFSNMRNINFDCKEGLKTFDAPTLIIQGKQDVIGVELARKADDIIPNSELVLLDKCAHYGWLDQPEQYYRAIEKFYK